MRAEELTRPSSGTADSAYLPGLDGLRALAVIAVLVFHANAAWLPGGFLGVEVFFVISGFIITRGLLAERERSGRIDLRAFWLRRARRLLPALLLLLVSILALHLVMEPRGVASARRDALAAAPYATNWDLIFRDVSYFDSWERPSMMRHLWSLAIEEQFYLAWPVFLTVGLACLRRGIFLAIVLAGAIASSAAMAHLYDPADAASVSRVYYGTDTRAAALLIGAGLAFVALPGRLAAGLAARALGALGCGAVLLLFGFSLGFSETDPLLYRGGFLAVSLTAAVLVASVALPASLPSRLLGAAPLRWLGKRSYGVYLWHWPVFLLVWPQAVTVPVFAALAAASIAIAAASYRWLEEPVRRHGFGFFLGSGGKGPRLRFGSGRPLNAGAPLLSLALVILLAGAGAPAGQRASTLREARIVASPLREAASYGAASLGGQEAGGNAAAPGPAEQPGDRTDCEAIRGTEYRSAEERAFFLANCVAKAPPPAAAAQSRVAAPEPPATRAPVAAGRVTAIGDSVMLGAASKLAASIAGIEVDAAVGRQVAAAVALLRQRASAGQLGEIVVLHVGNNGAFTAAQFDEIMAVAGPGRRVVFVNLSLPRSWEGPNNGVIAAGVSRHANASLVDWHAVSRGQPGIFASDSVHLTGDGAALYAQTLAAALGR